METLDTSSVYDFLNAHAQDEALQAELGAFDSGDSGSDDDYVRAIVSAADARGWALTEKLVGTWLAEAFAAYDQWIANAEELSEDELDLVSGGSGSTTGTTACSGSYQCRSCCPGSKCTTCYCPLYTC